jgi:hypothetical protein
MLWAQFQPRNEAEAAGFFVGVVLAGLISGGIPFFTGLVMKQTGLAIIGGVISAGAGALAGCCAGIPVAIVFTIIIVVVAQNAGNGRPERSQHPDSAGYDYDEYGRAFRVATRDDAKRSRRQERQEEERRRESDDERRRESEDDWRRRAEDDRYRERGFRPRKRDDDGDA